VLIVIPREILAIKVATTGPPGVDTPIVPVAAMRQGIEEAIYRYLRSSPDAKLILPGLGRTPIANHDTLRHSQHTIPPIKLQAEMPPWYRARVH